ncbi:MAG: filamentous hemagglutinin N-terminal domain-containing protein [Gammaproteobacteria bacterium]|nr:filamentous hemagglutinin N-terminal domain-containing protein [Gammaproteobacteria bacterium]
MVHAEIVMDAGLNDLRLTPSAQVFEINAGLGRLEGGNLFHSFARFNLAAGESAVFSGPDTVNHVISRVTGGEMSKIDGLLKCEIPRADFYFINPAGIVFGEHARLDVGGSFYAGTADYLRLGEDGRAIASKRQQ